MTYYAARYRTPLFVERAKDQTLTLEVRDGAGGQATVASGTLSLFKSDGTALVNEEDITPLASGSATYDLLAATVPVTLSYTQTWTCRWELTLDDGTKHTFVRDTHLVNRVLSPTIDASDILRRHTDVGSQYTAAQRQTFVDEAWDMLQGRLLGDGRYPQMVLTAWSFAEYHFTLSSHLMFTDLATYSQGRGKYAEMAAWYDTKAEKLYNRLNWKADSDQDGFDDDGAVEAADPVIYLFDTPGWY